MWIKDIKHVPERQQQKTGSQYHNKEEVCSTNQCSSLGRSTDTSTEVNCSRRSKKDEDYGEEDRDSDNIYEYDEGSEDDAPKSKRTVCLLVILCAEARMLNQCAEGQGKACKAN